MTTASNSQISRANIVSTARSYLGTPFQHQGRLKGVGVDCVGLLIGIARELGVCDVDYTAYRRRENGAILMEMLETHLVRRNNPESLQPGDVLAMRMRVPQHAAIVSEVFPDGTIQIVHALDTGVVEHRLDSRWASRICGVFEIPGVTDD